MNEEDLTPDEERIAELAVRKQDLTDELKDVRDELRKLAGKVDLPVIVSLNGRAVFVKKPLQHNGVPQVTVSRHVSRRVERCMKPIVQGGTDSFCTAPKGHQGPCHWDGT